MVESPSRSAPTSAFVLLWAESVGFFGVQIALFLLPITAAFSLKASPAQLGMLSAAFFLPNLVLGLIAGAWADRHDRKSMLIQAEILSVASMLAVPIAAALNLLTVELLYLVSLALGAATVHFNAAAFALLPGLAGKGQLVRANSRLQLSLSLSRVAGPAVGGMLLQIITAPAVATVSAASFVVCGLSVGRVPTTLQSQPPRATTPTIWREIADGLRFVGCHTAIRATAIYTAVSAGFAGAAAAILPLYGGGTSGLAPRVSESLSARPGLVASWAP